MKVLATGILPLVLLLACGDSAPPKATSTAPPSSSVGPSAQGAKPGPEGQARAATPLIALADSPSIDLVANRYLWHLFREGLVIPLATEGLRKYNHEYSRPWTSNLEHQGQVGRVLSNRQSVLRFGWFDEPADTTLRLRVHGAIAGQKISISLNGKSLSNTGLSEAWQTIEVPVKASQLRRGENELKLHLAKAGTVGGTKTYGLWRSIEFASAELGELVDLQPARSLTIEGKEVAALSGFSRMLQLVELPAKAVLDLSVQGQGDFKVLATTMGGEKHELLAVQGQERATHHQVRLDAIASQLVRLEFSGPAKGLWIAPRIAMEEARIADRPKAAKNLILLVVDALRSDHVPLYASVYGKSQARMPNTETQAAKGAVVFLNNQAASPSSPPSHGSIQTGMIPRVHGVDGDRGTLNPNTPMISTQVEKADIAAGYFGNNPFGMGRLEAPGGWTAFHQPGQEGKSNDCSTLVKMMLDFSVKQASAGKRFFISSLPYETHTPYRYHQGLSEHYYQGPWAPPLGQNVNGDILGALGAGKMSLSEEQWKQLKGLYKGEAEYWDQCFGTLVKGLADAKLLEDTVLVLTSDHGEGMFEHGRMGHAFGHYRELGDVPFAIFWPALSKGIRAIETVTSHRDIAPTILDILGLSPDPKIQGESVLPLALSSGEWTPRVVSLEYGRSYSLRSKDYKLIADYNGLQEVYDLSADPWEKRDIKAEGSDAVRYLRDMAGFFLEYRSQWHYLDWGTLNRHADGLLQAARARESTR